VALSKAHEAAEVDYGDDLFGHVKDLNRRTLAILKQAEVSGDPRIALAAIREARSNTELLCRMLVAAEANKPPDSSAESVQEIVDKLKLLSLSEDGPPALTDGTTCDQSNGSTAEFDLKPGESHEEWVQRMVDLSIRSGENREG
jgi:hypothetical protein